MSPYPEWIESLKESDPDSYENVIRYLHNPQSANSQPTSTASSYWNASQERKPMSTPHVIPMNTNAFQFSQGAGYLRTQMAGQSSLQGQTLQHVRQEIV